MKCNIFVFFVMLFVCVSCETSSDPVKPDSESATNGTSDAGRTDVAKEDAVDAAAPKADAGGDAE